MFGYQSLHVNSMMLPDRVMWFVTVDLQRVRLWQSTWKAHGIL